MILIAHRGESYDAPENTLAAINLAWERNADAVEVDVHLSKDGKIVVIHDDNTFKLGQKFKRVKYQTLKELKRLIIRSYKRKRWINERIPTLDEVLETVPEEKLLLIEIKSGSEIFPELKLIIQKFELRPSQITLIGFGLNTMTVAKQIFTELQVYWVRDVKYFEYTKSWPSELDGIIDKAKQANLDGLDLSVSKVIDKIFVNTIKAAGLKLYVWTVNDPVLAKRLIDAGVDGITSDRPQWLRAKLEKL